MKRTPLRRKGKSDTARCKDRIQKLLTAIVRLRDGGCIFRHYPETGQCSGYTAGDHINTRQRNITYGDTRNIVCLCNRHHIFWKPQNPLEYARIVEKHIGKKTWQWVQKAIADRKLYNFTLHDWQNIEIALKQGLKEYENQSTS